MIRRLFWLLLAFSLLGTVVSSLALFAGPTAEVAQWSGWTFFGLSRARWEALHLGLGLLLCLSGLASLILGGRRMMSQGDSERRQDAAPAWITAGMVFAVVCLASLLMLPPAGLLVRMSAQLKGWHAKSFGEPPLAGASAMSPTELAKRLSLDPAKALTNLAAHNVRLASPDATLAEIAAQNGLVPAAVYDTMRGGKEPRLPAPPAAEASRPQTPPPAPTLPADPPPGLGRLKLADVCEQYGLNLAAAVDRLARSGIKASGDMTLRQIAQNNLMLPIEVYDALRGTPREEKPTAAPQSGQGQAAAPSPAAPSAQGQATHTGAQPPQSQPAATAQPGQVPAAPFAPGQAPAGPAFPSGPSGQQGQGAQPVPGQPQHAAPGQVIPGQTVPSLPGQAPSGQAVPPAAGQPGQPAASGPSFGPAPGQTVSPGQPAVQPSTPEGLERMTLAAFCRERGLEPQAALAKLKAYGIVAFSDMTFRELAIENNLSPEQIMQLIVR